MTCTRDLNRRGWRLTLAASALLAGAGPLAVAHAQAQAGGEASWLGKVKQVLHLDGGPVADADPAKPFIAKATAALTKGDGVAAEVALREAQAAGAKRRDVAARMGEAYIDQGDAKRAREWLGPAQFAKGEEGYGFRMLGLLERLDRDLAAAGAAYDRALSFTPKDPQLWVDIGRLRYAGGEQVQAADAVSRALAIAPDHVRALEFRAQLVRDQEGLRASLPWFEAGLTKAPDDVSLLAEYAATLGEMGRAKDMLAVTRHLLDVDPGNPRAFFLQAALAARTGNTKLGRALMDRTQGKLRDIPAAILLDGALNLDVGNIGQAVEQLDRLVRMQPGNERARDLLARALYESDDPRAVINRFGEAAERGDASTYLLTMVARAHEELDERDLAAPLLDRAAAAAMPPVSAIAQDDILGVLALRWKETPGAAGTAVPYIRKLLESGNVAGAETVAEQLRTTNQGAGDAWSLAGDVQLAKGDVNAAIARYEMAARVRLSDGLLVRLVEAYNRAGKAAQSVPVVEAYLAQNPESRAAARLAAVIAGQAGDWARSRRLLEFLRDSGSGCDVRLLTDLAFAQMKAGDPASAVATAQRAYALQRASAVAAQAFGTTLVANRENPRAAGALLEKARVIGGDNAMLIETRKALAALQPGD
jgi:tetratricopeptide (TPR) repeat protein